MNECARSVLVVTVICGSLASMFYGAMKCVEEPGSSAGLIMFLAGVVAGLGAVAGYCYSSDWPCVFQQGTDRNSQGRDTPHDTLTYGQI